MDPQDEGVTHPATPPGITDRGPTNIRGGSTGSRLTSKEPPMRDANATGRNDSTNLNHSNQGRAQSSDSDRREIPELQTTYINDPAGISGDVTAMTTAFKPLKRSLEIFLAGLFRTSERSEKPTRVFKKPRS